MTFTDLTGRLHVLSDLHLEPRPEMFAIDSSREISSYFKGEGTKLSDYVCCGASDNGCGQGKRSACSATAQHHRPQLYFGIQDSSSILASNSLPFEIGSDPQTRASRRPLRLFRDGLHARIAQEQRAGPTTSSSHGPKTSEPDAA